MFRFWVTDNWYIWTSTWLDNLQISHSLLLDWLIVIISMRINCKSIIDEYVRIFDFAVILPHNEYLIESDSIYYTDFNYKLNSISYHIMLTYLSFTISFSIFILFCREIFYLLEFMFVPLNIDFSKFWMNNTLLTCFWSVFLFWELLT